jgi:hypothetical protein
MVLGLRPPQVTEGAQLQYIKQRTLSVHVRSLRALLWVCWRAH